LTANIPISLIIPAYNEAEVIGAVLTSLQPYVETYGFEVIVVNDASQDETARVVTDYPFVRLVNHPYNKGYGAALKTGVRAATHEYVLTMDSDGQHRPEDILRLLEHLDGFDMVVGARLDNPNQEWIRKPGKRILSWVANYLSNMKIPDINSGFRLIRKHCVQEFMHILPNGFSFSTTITLAMIKAAYNVKYVPINVEKRSGGKSRVKQTRDGVNALLLIARCISLFNPLKIYIPVASVILGFSAIFSIYGIVFYSSFPKTGIVGFLTGILVLLFGILSDQVAAIRRQVH
jgi:glycosyltransferase involved in cell wall biosynthesis